MSLSTFNLICLLPDITTGFHTGSVYHDSRSSACDAVSLNYSPMTTCHVTEDLILQEYRCEILKNVASVALTVLSLELCFFKKCLACIYLCNFWAQRRMEHSSRGVCLYSSVPESGPGRTAPDLGNIPGFCVA